ncbi:MAG: hypothetical protein ACREVK_12925 [Gammaproteobacteria bacterium]
MARADLNEQFTLWEAACRWCDQEPADNPADPTVQTVFSFLVFCARLGALPVTNVYVSEPHISFQVPHAGRTIRVRRVECDPRFWTAKKQHLVTVAERLRHF